MSGYWHESDNSSSSDSDGESRSNVVKLPVRGKKSTMNNGPNVSAYVSSSDGDRKRMKTEWLSGSWPLKAFDGSLPTHKRKAEWVRFRDQFERIVSCKAAVDSGTKLTGMKIFAGDNLLNIIEMQEKLVAERANDIYEATISALNTYFNQTCDTTKERMIFREMHMNPTEPFVDWVLRLELQAKFCEFGEDQRKEEFVQALVRRSVPVIAQKLYEMSHIWDNDMAQIISYGKHLDYIRSEAKEAIDKVENDKDSIGQMEGTGGKSEYKVVNALHARKRGSFSGRFEPYKWNESRRFSSRPRGENRQSSPGREHGSSCSKCGRTHAAKGCKAYKVKCFNCGILGHFATFCRKPRMLKEHDPVDDFKEQAGRINQVSIGNTQA